jgi:hypothetical protein
MGAQGTVGLDLGITTSGLPPFNPRCCWAARLASMSEDQRFRNAPCFQPEPLIYANRWAGNHSCRWIGVLKGSAQVSGTPAHSGVRPEQVPGPAAVNPLEAAFFESKRLFSGPKGAAKAGGRCC